MVCSVGQSKTRNFKFLYSIGERSREKGMLMWVEAFEEVDCWEDDGAIGGGMIGYWVVISVTLKVLGSVLTCDSIC